MKAPLQVLLISCALSVPALAFAQADNGPVTRAEVRADLVRLEQAGYRPDGSDVYYPADIQAAEAKVAAQARSPEASSVGGVSMTGSSQSGVPLALNDTESTYGHH
jgi:hypothetical protein